eukprot:c52181_g1_i1.p1 GENE.c52181_g1_i1~~c52181_g1_i1.p1  ORF type:complete len:218 (-),score=36.91 c52181_g1_i1:66-674(-)
MNVSVVLSLLALVSPVAFASLSAAECAASLDGLHSTALQNQCQNDCSVCQPTIDLLQSDCRGKCLSDVDGIPISGGCLLFKLQASLTFPITCQFSSGLLSDCAKCNRGKCFIPIVELDNLDCSSTCSDACTARFATLEKDCKKACFSGNQTLACALGQAQLGTACTVASANLGDCRTACSGASTTSVLMALILAVAMAFRKY